VWADISPDLTILARAQQTVDRWRRDRRQLPFETVVSRASSLFWEDMPATLPSREAFRQVADAILRGEGHAFRNREPLLEITHRLLTPVRSR
jgi:hypothetical protein